MDDKTYDDAVEGATVLVKDAIMDLAVRGMSSRDGVDAMAEAFQMTDTLLKSTGSGQRVQLDEITSVLIYLLAQQTLNINAPLDLDVESLPEAIAAVEGDIGEIVAELVPLFGDMDQAAYLEIVRSEAERIANTGFLSTPGEPTRGAAMLGALAAGVLLTRLASAAVQLPRLLDELETAARTAPDDVPRLRAQILSVVCPAPEPSRAAA